MDFLHSKAKQFAIEQVGSMPTGLGTAQRGRLLLYKRQMFFWDGSNWIAPGRPSVYELTEIIANGEAATENDANFMLCDDSIDPTHYRNYHRKLSIYIDPPGTYISGCHGKISFVGRYTQSAGDLLLWHGIEVVISSTFGSYFALGNDAAVPSFLEGKAFPILTNEAGDIYRLRMAHLRFDGNIGKWRLISFESIQWNARIDLSPVTITTYEPIVKQIQVPIKGIYQVDVFVKVRELDNQQNLVPDLIPKTLEIGTDDDQFKFIDIAPNTQAFGSILFVSSLQGSKIVSCLNSTNIYIRINLPQTNAFYRILDAGYVDIEYLGNQRINKTWTV
ncbi:hypothetical protein D9V84_10540 [Bacteroidetes/Chlorobi group bacterium Naka2016]|jgi:hypothetical protein|nr:MAG: hypothetical protein D9V84_10540 [Bacteroidetes/Chlorobi group bacterium Naka2016]